MTTTDTKQIAQRLTEQTNDLKDLGNMLRYGVLIDAPHIAHNIADRLHSIAEALESLSKQQQFPEVEGGKKK